MLVSFRSRDKLRSALQRERATLQVGQIGPTERKARQYLVFGLVFGPVVLAGCSGDAVGPPSLTQDAVAQAAVTKALVAASQFEEGRHNGTFQGITFDQIVPGQSTSNSAYVLTSGESQAPGSKTVVSIKPCTDGSSCRQLQAAVRSGTGTCWLGLATFSGNSTSGSTTPRFEYGSSKKSESCSASSKPTSAWKSGWR